MTPEIRYSINRSSAVEILEHLIECDSSFIPPLSQSVNIREYASKIRNYAHTFEAWSESKLVGLVAAYLNDTKTRTGFITNVSVLSNFQRKGIAIELLKRCLALAKEFEFGNVSLEVSNSNSDAIRIYKKLNFETMEEKNNILTLNHKS